jgi:phosphate transport system permease protein
LIESENHVLIWGFLILTAIAIVTHIVTLRQASALRVGGQKYHSLPVYHGYLAAAAALLTGIVALLGLASHTDYAWLIAALLSLAAACFIYVKSKPAFKARDIFEKLTLALLVGCSVVAILTTLGIFASVVFESVAFFREINILTFLFGTLWAPTGTPPSFGFIPLLAGTFLITAIAIVVAAPLGLMSAIYMAEYASPRIRGLAKPLLEMLAGIPTVVLGFFAALTVAPLIRNSGESIGLEVSSESALAAGLVMGMMIVPLISSLSDDIISAVPQSLRDGSFAMGATKSETIKRVVLPAALPGIVSAIMLAISRAVGETMIVVMAAGLAANLSFNPLDAVSTITVQIATLLVGDQEFDSAKTLSAFALGLVLFFFTLALNYIALRIVQKYKQQYD